MGPIRERCQPAQSPGPHSEPEPARVGAAHAEITTFVGIDVSKTRLDGHLLPAGTSFACANDEPGLRTILIGRLGDRTAVPRRARGHRRPAGARRRDARRRRLRRRGRQPAPGPRFRPRHRPPRQDRPPRRRGDRALRRRRPAGAAAAARRRAPDADRPRRPPASAGRDAGGREDPPQPARRGAAAAARRPLAWLDQAIAELDRDLGSAVAAARCGGSRTTCSPRCRGSAR